VGGAVLALILGGTLLEAAAGCGQAARRWRAWSTPGRSMRRPGTRSSDGLRHVVEEMALASGHAGGPRVYRTADEPGINAFAAGNSLQDAVIAVTRGALTRLSRDELQGRGGP
jgi:Zn-dependent protease with chaperone function